MLNPSHIPNFGHTKNTGLLILLVATLLLLFSCDSQESEPMPDIVVKSDSMPDITVETNTSATFLALSDVHYGSFARSDWYHRNSETNDALWKAAQAEAANLIVKKNPSFVIYLGDLPAHNENSNDRENEFSTVLNGLETLVAGTNTRLLYLPGNNDSVGDDYCSFTYQKQTPFDFANRPKNWPVVNGDNDIINDQYIAQGYYSVFPQGRPAVGSTQPALRVIMLNTVIFTDGYYRCMGRETQQKHANEQLNWLRQQLANATTVNGRKDKVLLAMHVPPGWNGFGRHGNEEPMWDRHLKSNGVHVLNQFLSIVNDYSSQIVGLLHSHTHLNGIRRIRNCNGDFIELGVSIPAITTDHGSNPAIKVFDIGSDFELYDNETYYATDSSVFWSNGDSFTFRNNYSCPNCSQNATMKEWIDEIGDTTKIVNDMKNVLQVNSHRGLGGCCWRQAIDVECVN